MRLQRNTLPANDPLKLDDEKWSTLTHLTAVRDSQFFFQISIETRSREKLDRREPIEKKRNTRTLINDDCDEHDTELLINS